MKVLAMYLPQYHEVEENNIWWGTGYTEWTAVKKAKAYSKEQVQPRVPLNNNYYDLSDKDAKTWKWQADLAREYNVYGFVIYHYWFKTGKQLLEKPMEILLQHPEININYCVCWANETWTRTWYGTENEVLLLQEYGRENEWKNHFDYLLQFFKDKRYIKIDNKPVINIYHTFEINDLKEMISYWNKLAIDNQFNGVYVISGNTGAKLDNRVALFDAYYNFEPSYSLIHKTNRRERAQYGICVKSRELLNRFFKTKIIERPINGDVFIKRMLRDDPIANTKVFPGVFPQWDNSPRRQYKGTFFKKMTPERFREQVNRIGAKYSGAEFLYVNAWNEWGEGAYLEPDEVNGYRFLEVLRDEI